MTQQAILAIAASVVILPLGASVWVGRVRGWTKQRDTNVFARDALAVPWVSLYIGLLCASWGIKAILGTGLAMGVIVVVGGVFTTLSFCVTTFERPRWALPPWYRQQLEKEEGFVRSGPVAQRKLQPSRRRALGLRRK